jgi:hypothetical protein
MLLHSRRMLLSKRLLALIVRWKNYPQARELIMQEMMRRVLQYQHD